MLRKIIDALRNNDKGNATLDIKLIKCLGFKLETVITIDVRGESTIELFWKNKFGILFWPGNLLPRFTTCESAYLPGTPKGEWQIIISSSGYTYAALTVTDSKQYSGAAGTPSLARRLAELLAIKGEHVYGFL